MFEGLKNKIAERAAKIVAEEIGATAVTYIAFNKNSKLIVLVGDDDLIPELDEVFSALGIPKNSVLVIATSKENPLRVLDVTNLTLKE